jgi:hypothetical protein
VGDGNGAAAGEIRFSPDTIRGSVRFPQAADMSMLPRQFNRIGTDFSHEAEQKWQPIAQRPRASSVSAGTSVT